MRGGRGAAFVGRLGGSTWWGGRGPKKQKLKKRAVQGPTISEISSTLHSSGFRNNNPHGGVRGSAVQKTGKKEPRKKIEKGVRGSKIGPKASQNGPKWLQNASKMGSEGPLGPMQGSEPNKGPKKVNSRGLRGSILEPKMVQNHSKNASKKRKKNNIQKRGIGFHFGPFSDDFQRLFGPKTESTATSDRF